MLTKILLITILASLAKTEDGKNYIFKIQGMDDSVTPQTQTQGYLRISYWSPFSMECRCDAAEIRFYLDNKKKYHIKKMYLGGPDSCCGSSSSWGGQWGVRKLNGYYSFFKDYDLGGSVSSYFQYDAKEYKWTQNNNTLITTLGVQLPGIVYAKSDQISEASFYYPEITFAVTIPLAILLILSQFVIMITYFCVRRKGAVPSYSIINLMTQSVVIVLIARRFTDNNTLFFFWPLVFPMIMMLVSLIINMSESANDTRKIKKATLIYQVSMILSIAALPLLIPYIAPFGIGLVGFECKSSSKNKIHAKKMGYLQILTCFAIWLYLAYPGTPADINPSGILSLIPFTLFIVNFGGMVSLIKNSEDETDTPIMVYQSPLTQNYGAELPGDEESDAYNVAKAK